MEASIQSNIDAWQTAFAEYVAFTKKTPQEALEHKLHSLGVALWDGFTKHEWGGIPRKRGIARGELAMRTASGIGTLVRPSLMQQYKEIRNGLMAEKKELKRQRKHFGGTLDQHQAMFSAIQANTKARISAWQKIVGREISLRQSGIGALGAAFLWYRNRGKGDGKHVVENRNGVTIGSVTVTEGLALIVGSVAGLTTVDAKYEVVAKAIQDETDDTMVYVKRKQDEAGDVFAALTR